MHGSIIVYYQCRKRSRKSKSLKQRWRLSKPLLWFQTLTVTYPNLTFTQSLWILYTPTPILSSRITLSNSYNIDSDPRTETRRFISSQTWKSFLMYTETPFPSFLVWFHQTFIITWILRKCFNKTDLQWQQRASLGKRNKRIWNKPLPWL